MDQKSADVLRRQLFYLSRKIEKKLRPTFTSRQLEEKVKVREIKPSSLYQSCVVYQFKCYQCDTDYVGDTGVRVGASVSTRHRQSENI